MGEVKEQLGRIIEDLRIVKQFQQGMEQAEVMVKELRELKGNHGVEGRSVSAVGRKENRTQVRSKLFRRHTKKKDRKHGNADRYIISKG